MNGHNLKAHYHEYPGPMALPYLPPIHPGMMHNHHQPHSHGFCHVCCHPITKCCCGMRQCRKESKDLLVEPKADARQRVTPKLMGLFAFVRAMHIDAETGVEEVDREAVTETDTENIEEKMRFVEAKNLGDVAGRGLGVESAYIGGGCCVHLSIEYTSMNEQSTVVVMVYDSEGTILAWAKQGSKQGYYIKECIISTNPGAKMDVVVVNAIARVRWCEVFSC